LKSCESPYGSIVETRCGKQINVFGNGFLLFCSDNSIHDEEMVHYAMIQHKDPKNILLISGGTPGIFKEIMKYKIDKIIYAEINPEIIGILQKYGAFSENTKVTITKRDARQYIRTTHEKFDVVLVNLPPPDNFQINRYYSVEFLKMLKAKLNQDGIVKFNLPSTINYVSDEAGEVNTILYNTLKHEFRNVIIVPGEFNYFLASDAKLSININDLILEKHIETEYVNQNYLDDKDILARSSYIMTRLGNSGLINSDFLPVSYFKQIIFQLSQFNSNYAFVIIFLLVVLIFIAIKMNTITLGIFIAGFTASSVEILVLFSYQVFFGYVYLATGLFFAIFMAGLSIGSLFNSKGIFKNETHNFLIYQLGIALMSLFYLIYIIIFRLWYNAIIIHFISFAIVFFVGLLMGKLFSSATKMQNDNLTTISANTYGFELIGSAMGAILISTIMLPLLGFIIVSIILCSVNVLCVANIFIRKYLIKGK